jgi:hypothetical protein
MWQQPLFLDPPILLQTSTSLSSSGHPHDTSLSAGQRSIPMLWILPAPRALYTTQRGHRRRQIEHPGDTKPATNTPKSRQTLVGLSCLLLMQDDELIDNDENQHQHQRNSRTRSCSNRCDPFTNTPVIDYVSGGRNQHVSLRPASVHVG